MDAPPQPLTFIVRLTLGDGGVLSGVVERARSGEKQRFDSAATLAQVIADMVKRETAALPHAPNAVEMETRSARRPRKDPLTCK